MGLRSPRWPDGESRLDRATRQPTWSPRPRWRLPPTAPGADPTRGARRWMAPRGAAGGLGAAGFPDGVAVGPHADGLARLAADLLSNETRWYQLSAAAQALAQRSFSVPFAIRTARHVADGITGQPV